MKYIKYTYVDKETGINVFTRPSTGPSTLPVIEGLEFKWQKSSLFPTARPEFFGVCPDNSNTNIEGVLEVMSEEAWNSAKIAEENARFYCPATITAAQIRLGFLKYGMLDSVEEVVKTLSKDLQIEWEYATILYRNSELIRQIGNTLNILKDKDNAIINNEGIEQVLSSKERISIINKIFQEGEQLI